MSFKTFKNGDTLYAKDLNDFAAAIAENQADIAKKADLSDVYTTTQADQLLAAKAAVGASYTKDEANDLLAKKADAEAVYTKAEIDAKISATFRYKGKIDSVDGLPTEGNEAGDVYKVADDSYVWNGTSWDQLDQDVDLSAYLTIEAADAKFAVADEVAAQYATQADMTEALAQKQPLGDYADESEVNAALAQKLDQTAASETYATKVELEGKQAAGNYVEYQEFQREGDAEPRLTIQLKNHNTISGIDTKGQGHNLAMVSKWDVADFGAVGLHLNLNSKDGIVTINDKLVVPYMKKFVAGSTEDERYTLELPNFYSISGLSTEGVGANLIMMSKWDIVDIGSNQFTTNLNSLNGEVKINDDKIVATTDQIPSMLEIATSTEMVEMFTSMQTKIDNKVSELTYDADKIALDQTIATMQESIDNKQPAGDYALKSELPAVDEFITKTGAEEQFAPKQLVIQIPIRTLEDKVYTKEQIFGWFKCKDEIDLKTKMTQRTIPVLYMCVTYSSLPHVYTMAVQYLAFESQTQVKLVCVGLDTKDDTIAKYTIVMNLDGTVFEGTQSNVKLEMKDLEI